MITYLSEIKHTFSFLRGDQSSSFSEPRTYTEMPVVHDGLWYDET